MNGHEHRFCQVGADNGSAGSVVVTYYRPGRWTDAQILEEHAFTQELAEAGVPAVPPLRIDGRTLHERAGFRFALYPRRTGKPPNLDDRSARERLGRLLGRTHAVGAAKPFAHRPALDITSFGVEPSAFLLDSRWLPPALRKAYAGAAAQALAGVRRCYDRAGDVRTTRVHGDLHAGNVLWTADGPQPGPHFVDFDDARMGPAVQDLWMLAEGDRGQTQAKLIDVLAGYEACMEFDRRQLHLIEALRTLRLIYRSAWLAQYWDDPSCWKAHILCLRERIAAMQVESCPA